MEIDWKRRKRENGKSGHVDFIFRVYGIELGKIRVYLFRIFPSKDSVYFEIFDLETVWLEKREIE